MCSTGETSIFNRSFESFAEIKQYTGLANYNRVLGVFLYASLEYGAYITVFFFWMTAVSTDASQKSCYKFKTAGQYALATKRSRNLVQSGRAQERCNRRRKSRLSCANKLYTVAGSADAFVPKRDRPLLQYWELFKPPCCLPTSAFWGPRFSQTPRKAPPSATPTAFADHVSLHLTYTVGQPPFYIKLACRLNVDPWLR